MSPFIQLSDIPDKEILPGFHFKMIHTDGVTVAHVRIDKGGVLPEHHHIHEQVTNVISGELEMTIGGETHVCKAGECAAIPPSMPHSARALSDCYVIDVFRPTRDDYK
ncbi:MAG: cupin domain-containing protein [Saprospiraceae bacterium]|nr:cupin domain-containing protein [Saprospiraceae bacterium]